ncbi:MAG TPA: asparagine synthase (glutamine-hydrolyzing) [Burkholderiales bacterium]|nr:asparagine synthase (glutamine-hydrolyzing) [Burkholderiales bacterium]
MCGIAGILATDGAAPRAEELAEMIGTLAHRGPDGTGYYRDVECGLGHSRLSIIDIAGGRQPIHNEDQTVWVSFNGEIFNYIELRRELEAGGHRFYTQSDTEVLVHAYEQHGDRFLERLNGQFAIALWDRRERRLLLARDRTGIRPLFYRNSGGRLAFASEVKALFALHGVTRRLDPHALGELFTYWSVLPPRTVFAGIQTLPPGHYLVAERGSVRVVRYWDWQFPEDGAHDPRPVEECAEELRSLLVDAVRLQLRADVPVGAYLSGGLDSSVVTTLIKNFTDTPLRTFSLTFADREFDESEHQRELVAYLGTRHSAVHCTAEALSDAFRRAIWHTESPILRTAPVPLMLLSQRVRAESYKVVLTGEGADEVFAGYDLFKEAKIRRWWARAPGSKLRPRALERLYPYLKDQKNSPAAGGAFTQMFFGAGMEHVDEPYFAHIPRWTTTRRIWQFFSADVKRELGALDPYRAYKDWLPCATEGWSPLARDQYAEAHTLLSGYLLSSQGDRMTMANSVEGRFPYLDHRVIEFANRLPPRYKLRALTEKYVLKQAVKGLLPESIRRRVKQPYRAPDSQSFFRDGQPADEVAELLSPERLRDAGYFDPPAVAKLVAKCRDGRAAGFGDNMAFVGVLSTMLVDDLFVRRRSRCQAALA